jgi:hypothetical protein
MEWKIMNMPSVVLSLLTTPKIIYITTLVIFLYMNDLVHTNPN